MKKTIVFATNNAHKLNEVRAILPSHIQLIGLADLNYNDTLEETSDSFEGNALQKARFVHQLFGYDCFADDTGLEVEALGGEPGIYSSRYAGPSGSSAANLCKLLLRLEGHTNRNARFRTVIALLFGGREYLFDGEVGGQITTSARGTAGFGYDPVFIPDHYSLTFAELGDEVKNLISHRAKAVWKLSEFLSSIQDQEEIQ
jgi:XTP/dITP diphosphohydrolase